jgi:hypothetical protein
MTKRSVVKQMKHDEIDGAGLRYSPCHYGLSRIFFHGPKRWLDTPYIAFIGGTEAFGIFIDRPLAGLVKREIGQTRVNFGCVNGGVDAFVNDPTILAICHETQGHCRAAYGG